MKKYAWLLMVPLLVRVVSAEESRWITLRAGAVYRSDMKMKSSGGSYAGDADRLNAVRSLATPSSSSDVISGKTADQADIAAPASDALGTGNRTFDDGYVNISPPTTVTPNSDTWYWGYDSKTAQDIGGAIQYHRVSSGSDSGSYDQYTDSTRSSLTASDGTGTLAKEERFDELAARVDVLMKVYEDEKMGIFFVGGATISSSSDQSLSTSASTTFREDIIQSRTDSASGYDWAMTKIFTEIYNYTDTHNVLAAMPETYAGNYAGPGALLSDVPTSRTVATTTNLTTTAHPSNNSSSTTTRDWLAESRVDFSSDVTRTTLHLGPEISWLLSKKWRINFSPKLTLNWLDISTTRKEYLDVVSPTGTRTTMQSWRDKADSTKWIPGATIALGMDYSITAAWGVNVAIAREWCFSNASLDIGPSDLTFDFDSYNVEAAITRRF